MIHGHRMLFISDGKAFRVPGAEEVLRRRERLTSGQSWFLGMSLLLCLERRLRKCLLSKAGVGLRSALFNLDFFPPFPCLFLFLSFFQGFNLMVNQRAQGEKSFFFGFDHMVEGLLGKNEGEKLLWNADPDFSCFIRTHFITSFHHWRKLILSLSLSNFASLIE